MRPCRHKTGSDAVFSRASRLRPPICHSCSRRGQRRSPPGSHGHGSRVRRQASRTKRAISKPRIKAAFTVACPYSLVLKWMWEDRVMTVRVQVWSGSARSAREGRALRFVRASTLPSPSTSPFFEPGVQWGSRCRPIEAADRAAVTAAWFGLDHSRALGTRKSHIARCHRRK